MTTQKIVLEAAPADESLEKIVKRFAVLALRRISAAYDGMAVYAGLPDHVRAVDLAVTAAADFREREFFGYESSRAEWYLVRRNLLKVRDDARAYANTYASHFDITYVNVISIAIGIANGIVVVSYYDSPIGYNIADDLIILLGDRLKPIKNLDAQILNAIDVEKIYSLDMEYWHCATTHCRAGFACILHPIGAELERLFGPWMAGAVIYKVSTGTIPDFFEPDNEKALADIRACAAKQVGEEQS